MVRPDGVGPQWWESTAEDCSVVVGVCLVVADLAAVRASTAKV
jgi:hypothetical protein